MSLIAFALSVALMGQISRPPAPTPASAPTVRVAEPYDEDVIYLAAKTALADAKARAMAKDLSVRTKLLASYRERALLDLCKRFGISMEQLLSIIRMGEAKDGTAATRRLANNPAVLRQKQQNAAVLGMIGAQLQNQANTLADRASAQQAVETARFFNILRSQTNPFPGSGSGYYTGPRQPPGYYAGGVGSSHKGGTYVNPYTGDRYQSGN